MSPSNGTKRPKNNVICHPRPGFFKNQLSETQLKSRPHNKGHIETYVITKKWTLKNVSPIIVQFSNATKW